VVAYNGCHQRKGELMDWTSIATGAAVVGLVYTILRNFKIDINKRFESLEKDLRSIDQRLTIIDQRLSRLEIYLSDKNGKTN
jgi:hypothetical protein